MKKQRKYNQEGGDNGEKICKASGDCENDIDECFRWRLCREMEPSADFVQMLAMITQQGEAVRCRLPAKEMIGEINGICKG